MKNLNVISRLIVVSILFISCTASKKMHNNKNIIDGNWQLQTIVSQGVPDMIKTQFFNEAGFNCFVGSSWTFNSNNSTGSYTISKNAKECAALKRNISWFISEAPGQPKQFRFKRLDNMLKNLDDKEEFRFTIIQMDENAMQWRSETTIDGQSASFTYNFVRI